MIELPVAQQRLDFLLARRDNINQEIAELRHLLNQGRRSPKVIPPCGTESAYQRHRHRREEADDACRAAHAEHNRKAS